MIDIHDRYRRPYLVPLGLSLLVLAVFAVYLPGLRGGFVFDDYPNIVLNRALHVTSMEWRDWVAATFSSDAGRLQRPLAMLTFAAQHYFTGLDPGPMKLVNIAIHAFNALLVFGLCRALLRATGANDTTRVSALALIMASLWALMPINLMGVLFIVQRMESLSHLFVFAGLWLYIAGRERQRQGRSGWWHIFAGILGCGALGTLCKESAVLLPLYSLVLEIVLFRFRTADGARDRKLALFYGVTLFLPAIAAIAWLLPKAMSPGAYARRDFDMADRLLTQPRVLLDYLRWTVLPNLSQLSLFHDDYPASRGPFSPPSTLPALALLAALAFAAFRLRFRRPLFALGVAWFFAAQALTATFIPLELVFEHRNYFASVGVAIALVDLLLPRAADAKRLRIGMLIAAMMTLFYAGTTCLRANEWRDPLAFAYTEAAKHPASPRASYHLAQVLVILSKQQQGSPLTQEAFVALEKARKVPNSGILPAQGLLLLAAQTGRPLKDEWWLEMIEKLSTRPIGPQEQGALASLNDCVIASECEFPPGRMLAVFAAALSRGDDIEVLNVYGNYVLNVLDNPALAEEIARDVCRRAPGNPQYRENLIRLLIAFGKYDEASAQISVLRASGRFGSNETRADTMQKRLDRAKTR